MFIIFIIIIIIIIIIKIINSKNSINIYLRVLNNIKSIGQHNFCQKRIENLLTTLPSKDHLQLKGQSKLDLLTSQAFERVARQWARSASERKLIVRAGSYHTRPENQVNDFEKV